MKLTTALLGFGTFVGISLTGFLGYQAYDMSRFDDCRGYGSNDKIETCTKLGQYQDHVRFFEYETMKTNNVVVRCTEKTWHWDRTGTAEKDKIHTHSQLNEVVSNYCDWRVLTHK